MARGDQTMACLRASCVKHGFNIMQVKGRLAANARDLIPIGRAPKMLNQPQIVTSSLKRL